MEVCAVNLRGWFIGLFLIFIGALLLTACAQTPVSASNPSQANMPTSVVVRILDLDAVYQATPTALPTLSPPPTNTAPSPTSNAVSGSTQITLSAPVSPTPACQNKAEFVRHLTISDNTALKPGEQVAKIWQIRNIGDCVWTQDYSLVFIAGEAFGTATRIPFLQVVNPGETFDLRILITAPLLPGLYTGNWVFQTPEGAQFGVGMDGSQPLMVKIVVKPPPRDTPS
jgi:hypothetical protein